MSVEDYEASRPAWAERERADLAQVADEHLVSVLTAMAGDAARAHADQARAVLAGGDQRVAVEGQRQHVAVEHVDARTDGLPVGGVERDAAVRVADGERPVAAPGDAPGAAAGRVEPLLARGFARPGGRGALPAPIASRISWRLIRAASCGSSRSNRRSPIFAPIRSGRTIARTAIVFFSRRRSTCRVKSFRPTPV